MNIRNTQENYGSIAKGLHWFTAVLFLGSYMSVYYRHWFTHEGTPENWSALQLHLSLGVTIAVVVALRILWRVSSRNPDLEPGSPVEHFAAHAGHYMLYLVMIVAPLTGYLGTSVDTEFFGLFVIPMFESSQAFSLLVTDTLGLTFKEFEKPIDFIHKNILGEWVIWILILGHVGAALQHHFIKRDRTLKKMTNGAP